MTNPIEANPVEMPVSCTFPRSALVALLDPTHPLANVKKAELFGLLEDGKLTPIGEKVLAGIDVIALRHQMILAERNAR